MSTPEPGGWIALCETGEVFEGTGKRVEVAGYAPLAVFNVDGEFHVTDDTCTHGAASLADGWLEGDQVECPWHAGKFCVRTGEARAFPAESPIRVYACKVEDDRVFIAAPAEPAPA